MKKTLLSIQYAQVLSKYNKYKIRLERSFSIGAFRKLSLRKQKELLSRLERFRCQLESLKLLLKGTVVAGVTILSLNTAMAQAPVASGSETLVNTYTTNDQSGCKTAMDVNGNFVVVWQSYGEAGASSQNDIYMQRYNRSGVVQGAETLVNTHTTSIQTNAVVAMNGSGNFVVVWQSYGEAGASSENDIYMQRYNASGVAQGAETLVNTYTTHNQEYPCVAMDVNGNIVVAWMSQDQAGASSNYDIYMQRYNASGVAQGAETLVNTYTTSYQDYPSVAMDGTGSFVVAWGSSQLGGSADYDVYMQRYNASGVAQGAETLVNTYTTGEQWSSSMAIDDNGNFVVVWESYNQASGSSNADIYMQRYNASGVAQGSETLVNTYTTSYQDFPSVAMDGSGNFVVSWSGYSSAETSDDAITAQFYNASGVAQGSNFHVNSYTTGNQTTAAVAMSNAGVVIAWVSTNQASASSYDDVYMQRYGNPLSTGITTVLAIDAVNLYPNPSPSMVQVTLTSGINAQSYELLSVTGTLISSGQANGDKFVIDLSNQEKGMYLLHITTDQGDAMKKIVKQ